MEFDISSWHPNASNRELLKRMALREHAVLYHTQNPEYLGIYNDHLDNPTWAYGSLVTDELQKWLDSKEGKVTHDDAFMMLRHGVNTATRDAEKLYTQDGFNLLPLPVQEVVVDGFYNMGYDRFSGFDRFHKNVQAGNWINAVYELYDSKRAKQLPNRTEDNAKMLLKYAMNTGYLNSDSTHDLIKYVDTLEKGNEEALEQTLDLIGEFLYPAPMERAEF